MPRDEGVDRPDRRPEKRVSDSNLGTVTGTVAHLREEAALSHRTPPPSRRGTLLTRGRGIYEAGTTEIGRGNAFPRRGRALLTTRRGFPREGRAFPPLGKARSGRRTHVSYARTRASPAKGSALPERGGGVRGGTTRVRRRRGVLLRSGRAFPRQDEERIPQNAGARSSARGQPSPHPSTCLTYSKSTARPLDPLLRRRRSSSPSASDPPPATASGTPPTACRRRSGATRPSASRTRPSRSPSRSGPCKCHPA